MGTKTKTKDPIDYYAGESELDESYRAQQAVLDAAKKKAQQSADVSYRTLQKYLPVQNRMNGMHGLGVSETAMIDANNRHASRRGEIEESHAAGSAALLNNYRTEKKTAQDEAYANAVAHLESGGVTTGRELDNYLAGLQGQVRPEQMEALTQHGNSRVTRVLTNNVNAGKGGLIQGDVTRLSFKDDKGSFTVSFNENDKIEDPNILKAAREVADKESFMIGDQIYVKMNGNVYPASTDHYHRMYQKFYPQQPA